MVSVFRIGGTFVPFDDLDFDISSLASCRKDPKKEETDEGSRLVSGKVQRDEAGVMTLELEGTVSVDACAVEAMQNLGNTYPELSGYYPKPKGLLNP